MLKHNRDGLWHDLLHFDAERRAHALGSQLELLPAFTGLAHIEDRYDVTWAEPAEQAGCTAKPDVNRGGRLATHLQSTWKLPHFQRHP